MTGTHLDAIGAACRNFALVTGGSGLARGVAANFRGVGAASEARSGLPSIGGPVVCLSGSCSTATNAQVTHFGATRPVRHVDPIALSEGRETAEELAAWAMRQLPHGQCLVATTALPDAVKAVQRTLGRERAAALVEETLASVAAKLRAGGVRRFVIAGGETAGAVCAALGVARLAVGKQIAPGVPWCATIESEPVALALKSGNFGGETFFEDAIASAP